MATVTEYSYIFYFNVGTCIPLLPNTGRSVVLLKSFFDCILFHLAV